MVNAQVVRGVVQIVSTLGVQKVVYDIIKTNTIVVTKLDKVLVATGSLVIGSMVGDHAATHVDKMLNGIHIQFGKTDNPEK